MSQVGVRLRKILSFFSATRKILSFQLLSHQKHLRPKLFEDCYFIYLIRLNYRISPVRVRTSFGTPKDFQGSGPEYHLNTAHGSIIQLHLHCAHSHFSNDYIFTALLGYAVLYCCARLYCLSPETAEYIPRLHPIYYATEKSSNEARAL